jgi:hypothetical protein
MYSTGDSKYENQKRPSDEMRSMLDFLEMLRRYMARRKITSLARYRSRIHAAVGREGARPPRLNAR